MAPLVKKWMLDQHEVNPDIHHRKWSWADQASWPKVYPVPYGSWTRQNEGNPIIPVHGDWTSIEDATAIYDHDEKVFYIWYAGRHAAYLRAIGLVKFDPATNTTTYLNNDAPVIVPGDVYLGCTQVRFPTVILDDGTYYMAMMTRNATWDIYSAQSTDKITWTNFTKVLSEYVALKWFKLGDAVYAVCRKYGTQPFLAGIGKGATRYTEITLYSIPVLELGATGEWDSLYLADVAIYWSLGVFYIFYGATDSTAVPRPWKVGMCLSSNGWEYSKFFGNELNPIFEWGAAGKFDDYAVAARDLCMIKDRFYLFYAGHNGTIWAGIGYATLPY